MTQKRLLENAQRRHLLQQMLGVALAPAAALGSLNAWGQDLDMSIKGPPVPDKAPVQISPHCYVIIAKDAFPNPANQGFMSNPGFILTKAGVVVFDPGSSVQVGEMLLRQIRRITDKPVIKVFNSHYHGDHWLGNHAMVEAYPDVPVFAHDKAIAAIRGSTGVFWQDLMEKATDQATSGTMISAPSQSVVHGDEFRVGELTLRVHHYGQAHTPSDICLEVVEDKVVFIGDIAMDKRIANMEDGSYKGTFHTYDELEKNTGSKLWVPGHGQFGEHVLSENRELFQGIYETTARAFDEGLMSYEAKAEVMKDPRVSKYRNWRGFDSALGQYVSIAYLEVEKDAF